MATTPGPRRRETIADSRDDERDTLTRMQEPLGSMDRPGSRTSDLNEVNLPPGETARRTGNPGTTGRPPSDTAARGGRSFVNTFAIAAVVLLVAFLIAFYMGTNRNDLATGTGTTNPPVADSNSTATPDDATGSTTAPAPQTAPGAGDASGTTTPPANP